MILQSHKDDEKYSQDLLCYLFYFRLRRQPHNAVTGTIRRVTAIKEKTTEYTRIIPLQQWSEKDTDSIMKLR